VAVWCGDECKINDEARHDKECKRTLFGKPKVQIFQKTLRDDNLFVKHTGNKIKKFGVFTKTSIKAGSRIFVSDIPIRIDSMDNLVEPTLHECPDTLEGVYRKLVGASKDEKVPASVFKHPVTKQPIQSGEELVKVLLGTEIPQDIYKNGILPWPPGMQEVKTVYRFITPSPYGREVKFLIGYRLNLKKRTCLQKDVATRMVNIIGSEKDVHVYPELIFINHSCNPNCIMYVSPIDKSLTVVATKNISAGEEICFSYISRSAEDFEGRMMWVAKAICSSVCMCSSCVVKDEEAECARMQLKTLLSSLFNENLDQFIKVEEYADTYFKCKELCNVAFRPGYTHFHEVSVYIDNNFYIKMRQGLTDSDYCVDRDVFVKLEKTIWHIAGLMAARPALYNLQMSTDNLKAEIDELKKSSLMDNLAFINYDDKRELFNQHVKELSKFKLSMEELTAIQSFKKAEGHQVEDVLPDIGSSKVEKEEASGASQPKVEEEDDDLPEISPPRVEEEDEPLPSLGSSKTEVVIEDQTFVVVPEGNGVVALSDGIETVRLDDL
jgi:hypothetical protein